ncbi:MAG: MFS transporter, partial [Victivallales bacterium]|nr:MFS transporter [Victivallales bacterium]
MNKRMVFRFGVVLMFFTSMSKVLVPGAVFDPLQHELSLTAVDLASLGSYYMCSYALSQLLIGMLADRLGGVRVLLMGGISFSLGMVLFPMSSNLWLLRLFRLMAGFGAGIVFLGVAKLIADLYEERFSYMLGFALVLGYLGPTTGAAPMVWLVGRIGWRWALMIPSIMASVATLGIIFFSRGTMDTIEGGEPLWRPVLQVMGKSEMIRICLSSSIVFGAYYALLTLMGRKCLEDVGGFSVAAASLIITMLTIIVASCNLIGGTVCKVMKGHYGALMAMFSSLSLAGIVVGWLSLTHGWHGGFLALSYVMIALPAGFFCVYGTMGKEISPPKYVALAVALVNFWA